MRRSTTQRSNQPSSTKETKTYQTRGRSNRAGTPSSHWYEAKKGDVHGEVFQYVRSIKSRQVRRRYELAIFQQLYSNNLQNIFAAAGLFSSNANSASTSAYNRLSVNVVKSCVDTATARIAKSKPRAFVLPNKGDYRLKRKCKNMTKFLDGAMHAAGVYENAEEVFRDSCIYGDGALLLKAEDDEIKSEIVKIDELIIDQVTGMYDRPQEMFYEHPYSRRELLARFPKFEKEIEEARMSWRGDMSFMSQQDMCMVVEGWRMPSAGGGKDGRHVMCLPNADLIDEEWSKDYIPIVRFHWTPPTYGPFGQGIALELEGMQWTITSIMRDIAESIRNFAIPRVWVDSTSGVSQHSITNELSVNKYTGAVPTFSTPPAMAADVYQFLQWLIDQCYKQLGLSQLSAQSEKPAGVNSGVGLRTYQDIETQRFAIVGQRWERAFMQVARITLDLAGDMYRANGKLSMQVPGRGFIETVDWKDVSLKADQYDVQIWPTSILPTSPEGKLQAINEFANSGFMPKDIAIAQFDNPILDDWVSQETAARDNIEMLISLILDKSRYVSVDPVANIDLAITMLGSAYLRAQVDEIEPHKIDLLSRALNDALAKKTAATAPPQMAPGPPGGGGGAPVGQAPPPPPAPLAPQGAGAVTLPAQAA